MKSRTPEIRKDTTLGELIGMLESDPSTRSGASDARLLWNRTEAAAALGVSTRLFDDYRKLPDFPPPVILPATGQTAYPRYRVEDIKAWIDSHLAAA